MVLSYPPNDVRGYFTEPFSKPKPPSFLSRILSWFSGFLPKDDDKVSAANTANISNNSRKVEAKISMVNEEVKPKYDYCDLSKTYNDILMKEIIPTLTIVKTLEKPSISADFSESVVVGKVRNVHENKPAVSGEKTLHNLAKEASMVALCKFTGLPSRDIKSAVDESFNGTAIVEISDNNGINNYDDAVNDAIEKCIHDQNQLHVA